MASVESQIISSNKVICANIESLSNSRSLLSQNILSQLRNLLEGVAVFIYLNNLQESFNYEKIGAALEYVGKSGKLNFIAKFHRLIQKSASHFTLDGDSSERLMLKYYEYLLRTRSLLREQYGLGILDNLEHFPIDLDPSLKEYHERIAEKIDSDYKLYDNTLPPERYYIHKTKAFFTGGRIYYEVTFYRAINKFNKSDRIIAFTDIDICDKHAAMLTLQKSDIEVVGYRMPIILIRNWNVSIRPCEIENFARIFNISVKIRADSYEYWYLMNVLTTQSMSLLELADMSDKSYAAIKNASLQGVEYHRVFQVVDRAREVIRTRSSGYNVIRYLMLKMLNKNIKSQYHYEPCYKLSGLNLKFGCIPFEQMPFCTSLPGHNPRYWDLVESLNLTDRTHELLVRRVKNNVENHGVLYTPTSELEIFDNFSNLITKYNQLLYYKHGERKIFTDKGHAFILGYEQDTAKIIKEMQRISSSGIQGYTQAVDYWLHQTSHKVDDPLKLEALRKLFDKSCVALIYGAAGTGKSTMVDHIANYFNDKAKLFLAHTNPATDNLKRKVSSQNSTFKTISSHIYSRDDIEYDVLFIDECSTVSNSDLLKVLNGTKFNLLILVGDVYQIESIEFGNWFGAVRSFIHSDSVFELKTPYRTTNESLLSFWNKVRDIDDDIAESLVQHGYSTILNSELFSSCFQDEIVLCLNYDGLYGINNVNRFMQSGNVNIPFTWRESTFKVGDPILFTDAERFRPVIYNNLKGKIVAIKQERGWIRFDVWLDRPVSEFDVRGNADLEWVSSSVVRFTVYDYPGSSDEDDDSHVTIVPFQVAYAVSIHKAQGLEYDSVKIVITDANEDDISHNIFYTAVTRARKNLKIFWTPETQERVLKKLQRKNNSKDVHLLRARCGLQMTS